MADDIEKKDEPTYSCDECPELIRSWCDAGGYDLHDECPMEYKRRIEADR
jgi:hypothetical protein